MPNRIAVVTGSNKGIGFAIVRSLCRHLGKNGIVYLTARDEGRGLAATKILKKEGLSPMFHKLDITDQETIETFRDHLQKTHNGIDILVNNAGLGTPHEGNISAYEKSAVPVRTNFFGFLNVCHALMPLVRSEGRVVNVASTTANMAFRTLSEDLQSRFRQASKEADVEELMEEFLESSKVGMKTVRKKGWSPWGYAISKLAVIVLSRLQAEELQNHSDRRSVLVNACCPGFVLTDMTADLAPNRFGGTRVTPDEGADTPVYLALLPPDTKQPNGQFLLRLLSWLRPNRHDSR